MNHFWTPGAVTFNVEFRAQELFWYYSHLSPLALMLGSSERPTFSSECLNTATISEYCCIIQSTHDWENCRVIAQSYNLNFHLYLMLKFDHYRSVVHVTVKCFLNSFLTKLRVLLRVFLLISWWNWKRNPLFCRWLPYLVKVYQCWK